MTDEKLKAAAAARFTEYLKSHRMRRTPERFAILDKVYDTASHFSIDQLTAKINEEGYHVSRSTVYNTIDLLTDCGLIRRHTTNSRVPRYEKSAGLTRHFNLVCSRCGKVREFKDSELDQLLSTRRFGKFHPEYIDLNVCGLCAACVRQEKAKTKKRQTR